MYAFIQTNVSPYYVPNIMVTAKEKDIYILCSLQADYRTGQKIFTAFYT